MSCNITDKGNMHEPYRMNDGRGFTDYRSSRELNSDLINLLKLSGCNPDDSYEYKLCLIRNQNKILKNLNNKAKKEMGIYKC